MRKRTRFLAGILAMTLCLGAAEPVLADYFTWQMNGEDVESFLCDDCGEGYLAEEVNECRDCEGTFCESCFCTSCGCCYEHCTCEFNVEELLDLDTAVDIPELPEPDLSGAEALCSRDISGEDYSAGVYMSLSSDFNETSEELLRSLCGYSATDDALAMASCVSTLKRVSELREQVRYGDSTNVLSGTAAGAESSDHIGRYLKTFSESPAVTQYINKNFNWSDENELFKGPLSLGSDGAVNMKHAELLSISNSFLSLLKKNAIASGIDASRVNSIKLEIPKNDALDQRGLDGEWVDDDNKIYLNIYSAFEGREFARTILHEFEHALHYIEQDSYTFGSVREVRMYVAKDNYRDYNGGDNMVGYMTQLEERLPRTAEYLAGEKEAENAWSYLVKHYGYDLMPVALEHENRSNGYSGKSMSFVTPLYKIDSELSLIASDIDFSAVPQSAYGSLRDYLHSDGTFVRYQAANGTMYVLPCEGLLEKIKTATGNDLREYYQAVVDLIDDPEFAGEEYLSGEKYADLVDMAMRWSGFGESEGPETHRADELPCTDGSMTVDDFYYFLSIAAAMTVSDSLAGDTSAAAAYQALLTELEDKAEELEQELECLEELESLADELETLTDDAASLQDTLAELLAEYYALAEEYEERSGELESELSGLAEAALEDGRNTADDASDLTLSELEDYAEGLKSDYESEKEALEGELQDMADELQTLAGELADLEEELEALLGDIETQADELDSAAERAEELSEKQEELEDALEALSGYLESSGGDAVLHADYARQVQVTVTDAMGNAVVGAPLYLVASGSTTGRFLGKTDSRGRLEAEVNVTANRGLTLRAGKDGKAFSAADGSTYAGASREDLLFMVRIEEDTPVFVLEAELELTEAEPESTAESTDGLLRVTLRAENAAKGKLRNYKIDDPEEDGYSYEVSWLEYYEHRFTAKTVYEDDIVVAAFWPHRMTEDKADYYGAYLLPLSEDGELPRTDLEPVFCPLYRIEGGKPVSCLVKSDDFAAPSERCEIPFTSVAFDFGSVPAGRYELVILLPETACAYHFQEITVEPCGSERTCTTVLAQSWNSHKNPTSEPAYLTKNGHKSTRFDTVSVDPTILSLSGQKLGTLEAGSGCPIALSVDASGRSIWSVLEYSSKGKLEIPVRTGFGDSGWDSGSEGDSREDCTGQIYLYGLKETEYRLLPVSYSSSYQVKRDQTGKSMGQTYLFSRAGRLYALSAGTDPAAGRPVYVAFWEQYYGEDGRLLYRTYDRSVSFELHWETGEPVCSGSLAEQTLHLLDPVSTNVAGEMTNYTFQKTLKEKGASYRFTYYEQDPCIYRGQSLENIPVYYAAERLYMEDGDTLWPRLPDGLTGTAVMYLKGENEAGKTVKETVTVQPQLHETADGIVLRFIVGTDCCGEAHSWQLTGTTATCTAGGISEYCCLRCGKLRLAETGALGHQKDSEAGTIELDATAHGYECTRCGSCIATGGHSYGAEKKNYTCTSHITTKTCTACGHVEQTVKTGSWHEYETRAKVYYDSEYHWKYCKLCKQQVKEKHKLINEGGVTYCGECGFIQANAGSSGGAGLSVWIDRSVCCPHVKLNLRLAETETMKKLEAFYGHSTVWEFSVGGKTVTLGSGNSIDLSRVSQNLYETDSNGSSGAVRAIVTFDPGSQLKHTYTTPWVVVLPVMQVAGIEASCSREGVRWHYRCSCGLVCDKSGKKTDPTLARLPHSYSDDCDTSCNECGAERSIEHSLGSKWETQEGSHYHRCTVCGTVGEYSLCSPSDWIVDVPAACETGGRRHRECTVCGTLLIEEELPPAHAYACTGSDAQGAYVTEEHQCTECGRTETVTGELPVAHERIYVPAVPAAPGQEGCEAYYLCTDTGVISIDKAGRLVVSSVQELVIPAADAPPEEPVTEKERPSGAGRLIALLCLCAAGGGGYYLYRRKKKDLT